MLIYSGIGNTDAATTVLKRGSRGDLFKQVQTKLNNWGYNCGTADGIFGTKTYNAVVKFQRNNKLVVDGIVGAKTFAAMGINVNTSSSGGSSSSSSDLYLLAKCIHAEARGEPYTGQVAVGAVILNRVRSSQFPNSISGVIYQPYAFTCVADGQINLEPDSSSTKAARDAMNGWDPTNGCIYYYNPATATSAWIWSRPIMLSIGRHNFCK
ncbi:MAG: spore cortex-lytic enzyme [Clostridia bacterium]|nr:spore cortex-lytic enzyme [Clostridia bacterium]